MRRNRLDGRRWSGDGTNDSKEEQQITVTAGTFTISEKKVAEIKGGFAGTEGLTADPASIREEVGTQEITLTVTLASGLRRSRAGELHGYERGERRARC